MSWKVANKHASWSKLSKLTVTQASSADSFRDRDSCWNVVQRFEAELCSEPAEQQARDRQ